MATFGTAVSGGITPSGAIGQQLAAITRRAFVPSVFVQVYQSHPLLSLLLQNAQRARGGVSQVTIPVQGASFVSFNWGSFAGDFPMPEDQAAISDASFNLKMGMIPIGFFGMEAIIQSSEVVIPKLRAVMSDAAVVIKQAFASSLYTNNYANPQALDSLVQAYDDGTNVTSYGGIAKSNAYWQGNYLTNGGGATSPVTRTGMAVLLTRIMTYAGGEAPDFAVMNPADWASLLADFMGYEMYQTRPRSIYAKDDVVNAGFRAIRVLDTPIFPDPFCPRGEMYAINSKYLAMYLSEYAPFVFSGFESAIPQGQIADIGVLISCLNLVCSKPSSGAHVVGITGSAWPATAAPPAVL
ncbi:MAG: phage major capsid protein [Patescibacteria group bacterium]|nr:phage major capsid protein [Patescibacteria group bacterium]